MNEERLLLRELVYGASSHAHLLHALEGLDPELAGACVPGSAHTIFQVLHHMVFWQDMSLARLRGEFPADAATAAESWAFPERPEDESDWEAAIAHLAEGLRGVEAFVADPDYDLDQIVRRRKETSARREIFMLQGHNSYHLGQIVQLRQQLGSWPPPKGGVTW